MSMRRLLFVGCLFGGFAVAANAGASTTTANLAVTATVTTVCLIAATPLAFGNYDPTSATPTDTTSTITVTCTAGTSFTVGLGTGGGTGATVTNRSMTFSGNSLNYAIYQDSGHSTNWGNTPGTDTPASQTSTTTPTTMTAYGRISAQQDVPAGGYTDTVVATVNY